MSISITPGRDFGDNEVPTVQTLREQAAGLIISGLPSGQLTAGFANIQVNDATSVSNLPMEGGLWFDKLGNLWGATRMGAVQVKRYAGGWESVRFMSLGSAGGPVQPGDAFMITTIVPAASNPTNTRLSLATGNGHDGTQLQCAVNQETVVSDATLGPRMVFRGPTRLYAPDFAPFGSKAAKGYKHAAFGNFWILEDFLNDAGKNTQIEGQERDPEADTNDEVRGHMLGLPVRDN